MDDNLEILFGAVLIAIYAVERFNTPPTIRTSTTAGRYYVAVIVYLLIYLATFYVFTKYPELVERLEEIFNIDLSKIGASGITSGDSTAILVAVIPHCSCRRFP